jgi:hypothetical protein
LKTSLRHHGFGRLKLVGCVLLQAPFVILHRLIGKAFTNAGGDDQADDHYDADMVVLNKLVSERTDAMKACDTTDFPTKDVENQAHKRFWSILFRDSLTDCQGLVVVRSARCSWQCASAIHSVMTLADELMKV